MQKIISLFQKDYEGDRLVLNGLVSGSEWVVNGEGRATQNLTALVVRLKVVSCLGGMMLRRVKFLRKDSFLRKILTLFRDIGPDG